MSGPIRIDNDGSFPFEYLGRVKAEGMTTAQIEAYLAKALGDGYLRNPQVSVEVVEYRSQSVFVTGEVRAPNKYSLPGNSTLMDVLTLAGSVTPNAGNWVQITHARQGAEVLGPAVSADYDMRVNLRDIQTGKAQNVQMRDGDTIFVPKAERVWVVGQVRNPQGIVYEEGMTVFEAIAAAGGITEKGSNSRIEIVRIENGQRKSIDAKQTDVLKPGDQVNVKPGVCEDRLPQPERRARGAETALLDMLAAIREARPDWTLAMIAASSGPLLAKAAAYADVVGAALSSALARLGEWGDARVGRLPHPPRRSDCWPHPRRRSDTHGACKAPSPSQPRHHSQQRIEDAPSRRPRAAPVTPGLCGICTTIRGRRRLTAQLLTSQVHRCNALLANSDSVAAQARERFGAAVPVHTIYNSIDLERLQSGRSARDLDALAGLPPLAAGGIRVGLVATFAQWKGHAVFLDALARLRGRANVRGYVVGDAIYDTDASQFSREQLRAQAEALGLGDTVGFTGKVDDVSVGAACARRRGAREHRARAFRSRHRRGDGLRRPLVVSRAGGAAEIAQEGAVFHEPGNSAELADRLCELASDPARRARARRRRARGRASPVQPQPVA